MTELENLVVKLSADVKGLSEGMKTATDAVKNASDSITKNLKDTETKSKSVFDNIKTAVLGVFGGNILTGLASRFVGTMSDAFESARAFSRGIAEINSVLPQNEKLTKAATDQIIKFSSQYGTSAAAQAKAYYDIVTSGVEGAEAQIKLLAAANETATAGLISTSSAVKILTQYLDAYSKAGYDATKISDILFKSAQTGGMSFEKMANQVASLIPTAKSAGISLEELSTTLGFLTKQGQSAEVSSAQLEAIMKAIINPTAEAAEYAKKLGIEFDQSALKSKGLTGILEQVIKATGGNVDAISALFPKMIATNGVVAIAEGNFNNLKIALDQNSSSMGATAKASEEVKKSMDFEMSQLEAEVKNLALGFTVFLLPAIKAAIGIAKDALTGFQNLKNAIANFIDPKYEELDDVVDKIKSTRNEINNLIEVQNNLKAQQNILGGRDVEIEENRKKIIALKADYLELQTIYKDMSKEGEKGPERAPALVGPGGEQIPGTPAGAPVVPPPKASEGKELELLQKQNETKAKLYADDLRAQQEKNKMEQENLDAAYELKLISQDEYYAQKGELNDEQLAIEDELNAAKLEEDLAGLLADYEGKLITHQEFLDQKYMLEEGYDAKHFALLNKGNIQETLLAKKKKDEDKKEKDEYIARLGAWHTVGETMSKSHNKAVATAGKAISIATATISTYEAATKALAAGGGWPAGAAFMFATIASGLAQVAAISGVNFAQGITEIPPGFKNDSFPANLSSGERVVDADTNTDLKEFLRGGGAGGTSGIEISFKGSAMEMLEMELTDRWDKGVSRLRLKGIE